MNETAGLRSDATPARGTPRPAGGAQTCPECGATESWGTASWCPNCGYYPKLGTKVSADVLPSTGGETEELEPAGPLPAWFKILAAGVLVIVVASIFARVRIPADGPRTIWSLAQLGLGLVLVIVSHIQAFLAGGSRLSNMSMLDAIFSPQSVWKPVIHRLPKTGMIVSRATWGATATLCTVVIVGGLSWENLNQLFIQKSNGDQLSPFQKAMLLAGKGNGKDDSEESGDAIDELMQESDAKTGQGPGSPQPAMKSQCAVIGFTLDVKGNLHSVLLATMVAGRPAEFVTKLQVKQAPAAIRATLEARLPTMLSQRPSVRCPMQAYWVKPDLTCMIGYDPGADARQWKNPEFLEIIDPNKPKAEAEAAPSDVETAPGTTPNASVDGTTL